MRSSSGGRKRNSGSSSSDASSVGVVVLDEHAALVDAVVADVGVDLVGGLPPALRVLPVLAQLGQAGAAVARHPADQLGGGEVLGLAADLPDAAVGLAPVIDRLFDLARQDRPHAVVQRVARTRVQVDGVEQRAPDVVLVLLVGGVADPHRTRALVALRWSSTCSSSSRSPSMPYITCRFSSPADVGDEVEEIVGLPLEAQREQRPQHERRVADPAVAVVPVAFALRRLGQRRRRRGDQRAGGGVRQPLERQRGALQVGPPGMVREVAAIQPVLPVVRGPDQPVIGLVDVLGRRVL